MPSRSSGYGGYGRWSGQGAGSHTAYGAGRQGDRIGQGSPVGSGLRAAPLSGNKLGTAGRPGGRPLQGAASLQLSKGDAVKHKAFGTGMVLSIQPMGGDALVEIAFESVGTKRLMLKSAAAYLTKT